MSRVSLVIVSHSDKLAQGVAEVAAQMAPDVVIRAAGGLQDGNIGTSFDKVDAAVQELVAQGPVVLLTDLGSATLTVESVLDFLDEAPAYFADGPLVEGAVAGAVAAQQGADAEGVVAAVRSAAKTWGNVTEPEREILGDDVCEAEVVIADPDGLHARPAALVARFVSDYDAQITIDEADAESVMSLMALGVKQGQTVTVRASGAEAQKAVHDLVQKLKSMPE
ncbi:dihydroxyacetone kinase phosphoryl donor subunit DhaM [uncultured Actinomyces sp.]|uniref:dihydroxyacetone kinase phosphoryl donor subunit DhaM n=1 Tax=uncultured Actinomyces sp. TaxID=249061 RepID=UPI00262EFD44|nr:dihydroxyacetone kinase phosphoryl donor subunit DhaM [uncultured Actinomyces sp.]